MAWRKNAVTIVTSKWQAMLQSGRACCNHCVAQHSCVHEMAAQAAPAHASNYRAENMKAMSMCDNRNDKHHSEYLFFIELSCSEW